MPEDQMRVLLVDDMQPFRQTVRMLLEQSPTVEWIAEASDGAAAVESALTLRPDVIVMDVQMPHVNGVEATRRVKSVLPGTAVIGFSVQVDEITRALMEDAGACAFVPKEHADELPAVIERLAALR